MSAEDRGGLNIHAAHNLVSSARVGSQGSILSVGRVVLCSVQSKGTFGWCRV